MAKYNLIRNSLFTSVSGNGWNKTLSATDLYKLTDNITTSSGVTLTTLDYLYLQVDLGQRIKVDGISLYASDLTKSSNIKFYYKDSAEASYSLCSSSVSDYYTAQIPAPSAPRYVVCTVSGVNISLYEFQIFNDDFVINFGADGTETTTWLDDTPIGTAGTPQEVLIFNNDEDLNGMPATAYVCVDYTGTGKDHYIELSDQLDGEYTGILEGAVVGLNETDWNLGTYNNCYLDLVTNSVKLSTSPVDTTQLAGRIGPFPILNASLYNVPFGLMHGWCYESTRGRIYALFWIGTTDTNGALKLYAYTLATNSWEYRGELINQNWSCANMTVCADYNYVYILNSYISGSRITEAYKHSVVGSLGNLTQIGILSDQSSAFAYNPVAVTDSTKIWYFTQGVYGQYSPTFRSLTVSGTFTNTALSLPNSLDNVNNAYQNNSLVIDTSRNWIYFFAAGWTSQKYVNRYNISTGVWTTYWFDVGTRINSDVSYTRMSYYNNRLFFTSKSYNGKVYIYNIVSDTVSYITLPFTQSGNYICNMIVTPPTLSGSSIDYSIYMTNVSTDERSLYGYNTGFELTSPITSIAAVVSGTYTSHEISFEDKYSASYFTLECSTVLGKSTISKDANIYNGIMEVRSSDTPFACINELFWGYAKGGNGAWVAREDLNTKVFTSTLFSASYTSNLQYITTTAICRKTGRIFSATYYHSNNTGANYGTIYSRSGTYLYSNGGLFNSYSLPSQSSFDGNKGVWVFKTNTYTIEHYNFSLDTTLGSFSVGGNNVYALSADFNGSGCWYVDSSANTLVKLSNTVAVLFTIVLYKVGGVCSLSDNGCWAVDNGEPVLNYVVKRFSSAGELLQTIVVDKKIISIKDDYLDGFWALTVAGASNNEIWHFTNSGVRDFVHIGTKNYTHIRSGRTGAALFDSVTNWAYYLDKDSNTITWSMGYYDSLYNGLPQSCVIPILFSWDSTAEKSYYTVYGSKLLPASFDQVWYGSNNLPWKDVPVSGYFLPKQKYHQLRLTLAAVGPGGAPELKKIIAAPVTKITDVQPQNSRPVYVRSNIPATDESANFNTRLKVWWDVED